MSNVGDIRGVREYPTPPSATEPICPFNLYAVKEIWILCVSPECLRTPTDVLLKLQFSVGPLGIVVEIEILPEPLLVVIIETEFLEMTIGPSIPEI